MVDDFSIDGVCGDGVSLEKVSFWEDVPVDNIPGDGVSRKESGRRRL